MNFKKCLHFTIFSLFIFTGPFSNKILFASTDSTDALLEVNTSGVTCDNDGVCDSGETEGNCPSDCGCDSDGTCETERGENATNCPTDCASQAVSGGGGGGGIADLTPPIIYNLVVLPSLTSATINWRTNEFALTKLYWGKTADYEGGVVVKTSYALQHSVFLSGLTPNTTYHYMIWIQDREGNEAYSQDQTFQTLPLPDKTPPANVKELKKEEEKDEIELFWENPEEPDFQGVRIVKKKDFFPENPFDGEIVFEGPAENFKDRQVSEGEEYYYGIFAYDRSGNFSSGAIIKARPKEEKPSKPPVLPPVFPPAPVVPPELDSLSLSDFDFFQQGRKVFFKDNRILARAGIPLTISISYDKLPEVLKTIVITLKNHRGEVFSFLLRVNEEKTKYQATIFPPEGGMAYPLTVNVIDYKHQALKNLKGTLFLIYRIFPLRIEQKGTKIIFWLILLGIFLVIVGIVIKFFRKDFRFASSY